MQNAIVPAQFRPSSAKDFHQYAKNLQSVIRLPLQKCQEILARIYGYSGTHELRQVLATKGESGFFNDDIDERLHPHLRQSRRDRVTETVLAELVGKTSREEGALCQYLGLFCRPKTHRERLKLLEDAIYLVRERGWPAEAAVQVCFGYVMDTEINFDLMQSTKFHPGSRFDPKPMIAKQRVYREPALLCQAIHDRGSNLDLPSFDAIPWGQFGSLSGDSDRWDDGCIHWAEYVTEYLVPELKDESALTDEEYDEIYNFPDTPTREIAQANRVLKNIPNVVELAQNWRQASQYQLAKSAIEQREHLHVETILKTDSRHLYLNGEKSAGLLTCFISLSVNETVADNQTMAAYHYVATFLHEREKGPSSVIGAMNGLIVVPFKNLACPCNDDFMWSMDSIAAYANDLWKVIVFDYFKKKRCTSVEQFLQKNYNKIFVSASVEIAPSYRGQGLLEQMTNMFCRCIGEGAVTQYDYGWRQLSFGPGQVMDLEFDDSEGDEEFGEVAAIIFPVEGTEPSGIKTMSLADLANISSPKKVHVPPNPEVEARRQKLEKHFLGLQGKLRSNDYDHDKKNIVDVLVYDPWSYPMT